MGRLFVYAARHLNRLRPLRAPLTWQFAPYPFRRPAGYRTDDNLAIQLMVSARAVTIDDVGRAPNAEALGDLQPAIDLTGLEQVLTRAQPVAERFHPHPSINGAYLLEVSGRKSAVTFRRAVLEAHPGQVTLLTYGTAELLELLVDVPVRKGPVFYIGNAAVSTFSDLESLLSAHGSQE